MKLPMVGRIFGRLTVCRYIRSYMCSKIWECVCSCGNIKNVATKSLTSGAVKSCGCLPKETGPMALKNWMDSGSPGRYRLPSGHCNRNRVLDDYKEGAKRRNLVWNISDEYAFELFTKDCSTCGLPPSQIKKIKNANGEFKYTGIDRIDNFQGYVLGNVRPMCKRCNIAKNNMTEEEFQSWIKRLLEFQYAV